MQDINPIILGSPVNIINSIIFILFLIGLYFLLKYLKKNKGQTQGTAPTKLCRGEPCVHPIDFKKQLLDFEKKYLSSKKDIFYRELAKILKEILEYKGYKNISKMTFEEINNLLEFSQKNSRDTPCGYPDDLLNDLIKNIYFKEYAKDIKDSEEIRKKLILEIKKLLSSTRS